MTSEGTPLISHTSFPGPRLLWRTGAILAAVGMTAGAFGAHGLKKRTTADSVHAWETASHYAIFNGLALLLISMHPRFAANRFAGSAIAGGGIVFSGSIMALVLNRDAFRFLGPVTPLGGMAMIAGYVALAF